MHYIYKVTTNDDRIYFGYTSRSPRIRLEEHIKDSNKDPKTRFHYALRDHGIKSFEVIHEYQYELVALKKEIELIYKHYGHNLLNVDAGGQGSTYRVKVLSVENGVFNVTVEKLKSKTKKTKVKKRNYKRSRSRRPQKNRRK